MNESAVEHTKLLNESHIIIVYIFKTRTLCAEPLENKDILIPTSSVLHCKLPLRVFHYFTFVEICLYFFLIIKHLLTHFQFLLFTQRKTRRKEWKSESETLFSKEWVSDLVNLLGKKIASRGIPVNSTKQFQNSFQELVMINVLYNLHSKMIINKVRVQSCCFLWGVEGTQVWLSTKVYILSNSFLRLNAST